MHFRRFCFRHDAVNPFCHALRIRETWHVASLGASLGGSLGASLGASVGISRGAGLERPQKGAKTTNRAPTGVPLFF